MKILRISPRNRALSLPELIVIMAVAGLLAVILLIPLAKAKSAAPRINCVNNLKQVALAFRIYAGDNGDRYPMAVYTNATGRPAFADSSNVFRYFQVMSNELSSPKIVLCPEDGTRRAAVNFTSDFNNQRVSYFVGLQAAETNGSMFLAGDRDLTSGKGPLNGLLAVTTNQSARWLGKIHHQGGNVAFADGSVLQLTSSGLNSAARDSGVTNWLLFP